MILFSARVVTWLHDTVVCCIRSLVYGILHCVSYLLFMSHVQCVKLSHAPVGGECFAPLVLYQRECPKCLMFFRMVMTRCSI